jgi:RHS repeat-associated protein
MSNKSGISNQVLPLPSGGGAMKGIGETFSPDLFTGTGNLTVPLDLPPGRNGFQPRLNLSYSTGNGNGPFGIGWQLSVPGVTRKTAAGVPRYDDRTADLSERDTFVLSGAEDLVQIAEEGGITRFRPRTEGLFARIERDRSPGDDVWRVRSRDGLVSLYGTPGTAGQDPAALADPADPRRVFEWRLTETADPFGNRILYEYLRDTGQEPPGRTGPLYPRRVRYVDHDGDGQFLVSVAFVYEERPDPFSDCRAGFEIRTSLRCRAIEVRTHADEELLVRTYELAYLDGVAANGASLLGQIQVVGHDGDASEALPPLELGYSQFEHDRGEVRPLAAAGAALPAQSLASPDLELVGLFANGLPDLVQMNGVTQFWRNLGGGRFAAPEAMPEVPALLHLADPGVQLADLNGDGRADLLAQDLGGYFPLGFRGRWSAQGFVQYDHLPSVALDAPDVRLMDLEGDGVIDALRTGAQGGFELFFNHPTTGWGRVETRPPLPELPDLSFTDNRVKLGDINGDGLQDLVLVEPGQVHYWPYLGHGRWGARVRMDRGPVGLPPPGQSFDPRRVLLGDVDGDGLDDLVYVQPRRVTIWINQSGNSWSDPIELEDTPVVADLDAVRLADLLGEGTAGILWSADVAGPEEDTYQFLDLTGGVKPYLLDRVDNHLGAVTRIQCVPSTRFYLADADQEATAWRTPLCFPVQVVERVEVIDQIAGGKLTTTYRYHHGYWDGAEREFRGFGRVEQLDTEVFEEFSRPGLHGTADRFEPVAADVFSPPMLTKTWFHPGPVGDEFTDRFEADFGGEYWPGDRSLLERPAETVQLLRLLPAAHRADAIRSLRGKVLRTELYALDGSERQDRPFTVSETQYGIREESPPAGGDSGRRRVFFPHLDGHRMTQWDRGTDPMSHLAFTENYDRFGQARRQTSLAVPRGRDFRVPAGPGDPYLGTTTVTTFAQRDDSRYIVDRVARVTTHEIVNDGSPPVLGLRNAVAAGTAELAVLGQTVTYYDGQPFEGLPLGRLGEFGVPTRSEALVMTEEILEQAHRVADDSDATGVPPYLVPGGPQAWPEEYPEAFRELTPALAGYSFSPGAPGDPARLRGYFVQQGRQRYDVHDDPARGRGLLLGTRDPLGRDTRIDYDAFGLLPVRVTDPAGLTSEAVYNYRILAPRLHTDENGNRTAFAFTPLGLLERVAAMGKVGEPVGDTLQAPGTRFVYQLHPSMAPPGPPRPVAVRTIRRVRHVNDPPTADSDDTIETVEYSDGFGRLVQTRTQAEDVIFGDPTFGGATVPAAQDDTATQDEVTGRDSDPSRPNVVVSGWQIHDNKGHVIGKFEPFFAAGWEYAPPTDAQLGQRVAMTYDPRGRVVRTVNPDGAEERIVHGIPADLTDPGTFDPSPWETFVYDANDNAGRTHAAEAGTYEHHWDTPSSVVVDALGRTVTTTARTRAARSGPGAPLSPVRELATRCAYDLQGNLVAVTDTLGRLALQHVHDLAGRPLRSESIDAGTRRAVLDAAGQELERRDSKGALILQAYDLVGRASRLWARDDASGAMTLRERLEYGDAGDPGQPPAERAAARAANLLGALHRHYDEAGLVTLARYDFKGGVLERSRQVIADGPIIGVFPAGGDQPPDWRVAAFRVDWEPPAGDTLEGHAARLLEPTVYATSMRYDALQRIDTLRCPAGTDGRRRELRLGFNRAGALQRLGLDDATIVERIAYDAKGQRTLIALGNGVMTRYAYDPRTLRLLRLRSERFTRPAPDANVFRPVGAPLQDLAYRYDLAANLLDTVERTPGCGVRANPEAGSVTDPVLRALLVQGDALVRRFAYDPLYRLTAATGRECTAPDDAQPWADGPRCGFGSGRHGTPDQDNAPNLTGIYQQEYTYDPAGNLLRLDHADRTSSRSRVFDLVAGTNRLRSMATGQFEITFGYDAGGNLVQETTSRHFEWDHGDRMKAFRTQTGTSEPSVHAHYLYGAGGERVKKLVRRQGGAVEVTTYIDGMFEHHRRGAADGPAPASTTVHVLDAGQRILMAREGQPHPDDQGPAVRYLLGDHLASSNLTVDDTGTFVNREELTPYGESGFGGFARKRYRFMAKERDEESGLGHHGLRYYAPWLARWTSTDPAGAVDGWNLYAFCRLNPMRLVDLEGTDAKERAIHAYSVELEQKAAAQSEVNRLRNIMQHRIGKMDKAYEALDALDTSGLSEKAVDKEIDRLTNVINESTRDFNEAKKALPGAEARLAKSTKNLSELTNKLYRLGVDVERLENDLRAAKKMRGGIAVGGGGAGAAGGGSGGGKAMKGMKLLGKITKVTAVIEAGVAAGKTVKHLANGDFGAAANEVKNFAYDQTVGVVKGAYDLGKSIVSGIGDTIFGPSEPKAPARPARNRLRDFALGLMYLTAVVGLAIQASQTQPAPEAAPSEGGSGSQREGPLPRHPYMYFPGPGWPILPGPAGWLLQGGGQ